MQGNLKQGQVIGGRYHIISSLGQGGFGHTYLAEDRQLPGHPRCAVKHPRMMALAPLRDNNLTPGA